MARASLIYAFDPLCGWCYGFIPALEALVLARPDIIIDVRLGGLVVGERVRPYHEMEGYIASASKRLEEVTGRALSDTFHQKIIGSSAAIASSIPPSAVILAVRERQPELTLPLAHAIQQAHFRDGADLNDRATYVPIFRDLALGDVPALPPPHTTNRALQAEFTQTRALGGTSFPTLIADFDGALRPLPNEYRPNALIAKISAIFPQQAQV